MISSLNRRELLRSGLAATAVASVPAVVAAAVPLPPSPVRLGIASYTWRKFTDTQVIAFMKQVRSPYLNVKDVHLPMAPASEVAARAERYRAAGLKLTAAGTIYFTGDSDDDVRAKFEYCKAAGISLIVGAPTHATLPRVERFAKQYNIRVAIHNHGPEDKEWPSPLDVLAAVKGMDARLGCCIDVGHTLRAGTDVVAAITQAGPRLFDLHMKDLLSAQQKESQVAVGEGIMPVREILETLIRMKYSGSVDLEYEINENNPLPGVLESLAYMRGVLTGVGYATIVTA